MMQLNLNETIKVKLTPFGAEIYYHKNDELIERLQSRGLQPRIEQRMPPIDREGFTEFQLWDFMNIYGDYFEWGAPDVIEDNTIYIVNERYKSNEERCACCGAIIPEGRQVCPICEGGKPGEKARRMP